MRRASVRFRASRGEDIQASLTPHLRLGVPDVVRFSPDADSCSHAVSLLRPVGASGGVRGIEHPGLRPWADESCTFGAAGRNAAGAGKNSAFSPAAGTSERPARKICMFPRRRAPEVRRQSCDSKAMHGKRMSAKLVHAPSQTGRKIADGSAVAGGTRCEVGQRHVRHAREDWFAGPALGGVGRMPATLADVQRWPASCGKVGLANVPGYGGEDADRSAGGEI